MMETPLEPLLLGVEDFGLATDLYQLTMMAAYRSRADLGPETTSTFELFVRRLPEDRAFLVAAGLEQALAYLRALRFGPEQIAYLRCFKIGYIFQTFNLIEVMTAVQNVMLPMTFGGISDEEAHDRAVDIMDRVGLQGRYDHLPSELSGGQQQRVAVARALANTPTILLADEPTGNLDLKTGEELIRTMEKLKEEMGVTVITATHDHKMLAASDRVVYLEDGKVTDIKQRSELSFDFGEIDGEK